MDTPETPIPPTAPTTPAADAANPASESQVHRAFDPGKPILAWEAPAHPVHERSPRWYLLGALFVLAAAAYGIVSGTWTMTLLTVLIGGTYFLVRREPTAIRRIEILEHGFVHDGKLTHWDECQDYWFIRTPSYTELHIRRKRGFGREVTIQTGDIDMTALSSVLSHFLTHRPDQKERLVDVFIRLFKL